jgi:hypothetical protein
MGFAARGPTYGLIANLAVIIMTLAVSYAPHQAHAGTPYESQLAGRIYAVLTTIIIGEFGGRTRANTDATLHKRICQPADYNALREAAKDNASLIAFHRQCDLIETKVDRTDSRNVRIDSIAYLPSGYCEPLKAAFELVLAENVHAVPRGSVRPLIVRHKDLSSENISINRELLRSAKILASCRSDGSLYVSATRVKR